MIGSASLWARVSAISHQRRTLRLDVRACTIPTEEPESDLKARILDVALVDLLGRAHETVAVYGGGPMAALWCPRHEGADMRRARPV